MLGTAAFVVALGGTALALDRLERARCLAQMNGTGPNRPGTNCGYQLAPAETEFRYAIDAGSERLLYLSGGTAAGPEAIRLLRDGAVVVQRPTGVLTAVNIDVCRNQPPRDARWWSALVDDAFANALRGGDIGVYRVEGLIDGRWRLLRLHDSGCTWHGHA